MMKLRVGDKIKYRDQVYRVDRVNAFINQNHLDSEDVYDVQCCDPPLESNRTYMWDIWSDRFISSRLATGEMKLLPRDGLQKLLEIFKSGITGR